MAVIEMLLGYVHLFIYLFSFASWNENVQVTQLIVHLVIYLFFLPFFQLNFFFTTNVYVTDGPWTEDD